MLQTLDPLIKVADKAIENPKQKPGQFFEHGNLLTGMMVLEMIVGEKEHSIYLGKTVASSNNTETEKEKAYFEAINKFRTEYLPKFKDLNKKLIKTITQHDSIRGFKDAIIKARETAQKQLQALKNNTITDIDELNRLALSESQKNMFLNILNWQPVHEGLLQYKNAHLVNEHMLTQDLIKNLDLVANLAAKNAHTKLSEDKTSSYSTLYKFQQGIISELTNYQKQLYEDINELTNNKSNLTTAIKQWIKEDFKDVQQLQQKIHDNLPRDYSLRNKQDMLRLEQTIKKVLAIQELLQKVILPQNHIGNLHLLQQNLAEFKEFMDNKAPLPAHYTNAWSLEKNLQDTKKSPSVEKDTKSAPEKSMRELISEARAINFQQVKKGALSKLGLSAKPLTHEAVLKKIDDGYKHYAKEIGLSKSAPTPHSTSNK